MNPIKTFSALLPFILLAATPGAAKADAVFNVEQVGSNVVATTSGSFDLSTLTLIQSGPGGGGDAIGTQSFAGVSGIGVGVAEPTDAYQGSLSAPAALFDSGKSLGPDVDTGDFLLILVGYPNSTSGIVELSQSYTSGAALSGTSTWDDTTLAAMGLATGTYTYELGDNAITVNIGSGPSAPEPASFLLIGGGIGLLGLVRRSRKPRA